MSKIRYDVFMSINAYYHFVNTKEDQLFSADDVQFDFKCLDYILNFYQICLSAKKKNKLSLFVLAKGPQHFLLLWFYF